MKRPHQILGVQPDAPDVVVDAAYRSKLRELVAARRLMLEDEDRRRR